MHAAHSAVRLYKVLLSEVLHFTDRGNKTSLLTKCQEALQFYTFPGIVGSCHIHPTDPLASTLFELRFYFFDFFITIKIHFEVILVWFGKVLRSVTMHDYIPHGVP